MTRTRNAVGVVNIAYRTTLGLTKEVLKEITNCKVLHFLVVSDELGNRNHMNPRHNLLSNLLAIVRSKVIIIRNRIVNILNPVENGIQILNIILGNINVLKERTHHLSIKARLRLLQHDKGLHNDVLVSIRGHCLIGKHILKQIMI